MVFFIQVDMTLEIITKQRQLLGVLFRQFPDERSKHVWDEVFPAEGEGGRDRVRRSGLDEAPRRSHKISGGLWGIGGVQGGIKRGTAPNFRDQIVNDRRVRAALPHRLSIHLKVAEIFAGAHFVAFLLQYDLVDEPTAEWFRRRRPRQRNARQARLQRLEQRHEVPDREHVMFHERTEMLDGR